MRNRMNQKNEDQSTKQVLGYTLSLALLAALVYSAYSVLFTVPAQSQEEARKVSIGTCILPNATAAQARVDTAINAFTNGKNPSLTQCENYARELAPKEDYDGDGYLNNSSSEDEDTGSPLIADLPDLVYSFIGKTGISINLAERTSEKSKRLSQRNELERSKVSEASTSSLISNTLARETAQSNSTTHTAGVEVSASFSFPFSASASAKANYTYENSETRTSSVGQSQTTEQGYTTSAQNGARELAEFLHEEAEQRGNKYQGGTIDTTVRIVNAGRAPIQIKDFAVAARQRTGPSSNEFRSIATLKPDTKSAEFSRDLAPKASVELPVTANISDLGLMESLLENPNLIYFQVITPQMNLPLRRTDQQAESFSYVQDSVRKNNVWLYVDYGRGLVRDFYVSPKTGAKTFAGVMKVLNLQYKTEGVNLKAVCKALATICPAGNNVEANPGKRKFWNVKLLGSENRRDPIEVAADLGDSKLQGGDSVFLVCVEDVDGDKVPRGEEVRYGTVDDPAECTAAIGCKSATDFDGDGMSDFEETQTGWKTDKGEQVFSNPLLTDGDGDGWPDVTEKLSKSNPRIAEWSQGKLPGIEQFWTTWIQVNPRGLIDSSAAPQGYCPTAPVYISFTREHPQKLEGQYLCQPAGKDSQSAQFTYFGAIGGANPPSLIWKKDGTGFTVTAGTRTNDSCNFVQDPLNFDILNFDSQYEKGMYLQLRTTSCGLVRYYRWQSQYAYRAIK